MSAETVKPIFAFLLTDRVLLTQSLTIKTETNHFVN